MAKHPDMKHYLQSTLRAEKARHKLTWEDLSLRLRDYGIRQTSTNLSTKINRGDMGAQLLLALLSVLEVRNLPIPALREGVPAGVPPRAAGPADAGVPVAKRHPRPRKEHAAAG